MNYTEFYVVPTSVDSTASNLNGGSGGTPSATFSGSVTAGVMTLAGDVSLFISLGQFFTFDTIGAKRRGVVTSTPVFGGVNTTFSVVPTDGGGAFGAGTTGSIFGGSWADPSVVAGLTTASVNAAGDPPRLNIYEPATYTVGMTITANFTPAIPLTISGYHTMPGDLAGTMTAPMIAVASGATNGVVVVSGSHINFENITVSTTQAGIIGFFMTFGSSINLVHCTFSGTSYSARPASYTVIHGCLINGGSGLYLAGVGNNLITNNRFTNLLSGSSAITLRFTESNEIAGNTFYSFTGDCIYLDSNNRPYCQDISANTVHDITGNFLNANSVTDLSYMFLEDNLFSGVTGYIVYSTASGISLTRYAHNLEYNIGGRFSSGILDNSTDNVTSGNPFANGGEIPTTPALGHAVIMPDGNYSYPDLGAMQVLSTDPGAGNVKKNTTYYAGGIQYTGSLAGGGGFIFGD